MYLLYSGFITQSKDRLTTIDIEENILTDILRTTRLNKTNTGLYSQEVEDIYAKMISKEFKLDSIEDIDTLTSLFKSTMTTYCVRLSSWINLQYKNIPLSTLHVSFLEDVEKVFFNGCKHTDLGKYIGLLRPFANGRFINAKCDFNHDTATVLQNVLSIGNQVDKTKGIFELMNFLKVVYGK